VALAAVAFFEPVLAVAAFFEAVALAAAAFFEAVALTAAALTAAAFFEAVAFAAAALTAAAFFEAVAFAVAAFAAAAFFVADVAAVDLVAVDLAGTVVGFGDVSRAALGVVALAALVRAVPVRAGRPGRPAGACLRVEAGVAAGGSGCGRRRAPAST